MARNPAQSVFVCVWFSHPVMPSWDISSLAELGEAGNREPWPRVGGCRSMTQPSWESFRYHPVIVRATSRMLARGLYEWDLGEACRLRHCMHRTNP